MVGMCVLLELMDFDMNYCLCEECYYIIPTHLSAVFHSLS